MAVIHLEIPPELSVRMAQIAGREGRLKEQKRRQLLEEELRARLEHRNKAFDEVEAYYSQLLISNAKNTRALKKYGMTLKAIKQGRKDPNRPPPQYHYDTEVQRIPVCNEDIGVRAWVRACVCACVRWLGGRDIVRPFGMRQRMNGLVFASPKKKVLCFAHRYAYMLYTITHARMLLGTAARRCYCCCTTPNHTISIYRPGG